MVSLSNFVFIFKMFIHAGGGRGGGVKSRSSEVSITNPPSRGIQLVPSCPYPLAQEHVTLLVVSLKEHFCSQIPSW